MKHQGTDISHASMPRVRFHARIVPNGVLRDRGSDKSVCLSGSVADQKLRSTLLLMPELVDDGETGGVPFNLWPREVHRQLQAGVDAVITSIDGALGSVRLGRDTRHPLTFHVPGLAGLASASDLEALSDIWAASLWKELPGNASATAKDWRDLAERIKAPSARGLTELPSLCEYTKCIIPSNSPNWIKGIDK